LNQDKLVRKINNVILDFDSLTTLQETKKVEAATLYLFTFFCGQFLTEMFLVILTPFENFELKSEKSSPKKCVLEQKIQPSTR
jgi:hypothetical protein